jgi:hypothetical protein
MMRKQIAERKAKEAPNDNQLALPSEKSLEDQAAQAKQQQTMMQQQMSTQVAMLYQHCEEQSQAAQSARELAKAWRENEEKLAEVEMLTHTANQSAQRAAWAVGWVDTTYPTAATPEPNSSETVVWLESMRALIKQATEKAGAAAQECIQHLCDLKNKIGIRDSEGNKIKIKVKLKCCHAWTKTKFCAKGHLCTFAHGEEEIGRPQPILNEDTKVNFVPSAVPCKFFADGVCRAGDACEFSHAEFQPCPREAKRPSECAFFQNGNCKRGNACIFAHGPEELAEIIKMQAVTGGPVPLQP